MATKIAFINNKGGSTKTTTLVNLAGALCNRFPNRKILIIEGDGQGNASSSFKNVKTNDLENSTYDIFMGNVKASEVVINAFQNIDIIPAKSDMNYLEFDVMARYEQTQDQNIFNLLKTFATNKIDMIKMTFDQFLKVKPKELSVTTGYFNMLNGKMDELDKKYDYILFDTPPEIKAVTSSILAVSDYAIIPFEPDSYAIDGIMNILSRIESIRKDYNSDLKVAGLLAAKVRKSTKLHSDIRRGIMMYCMNNDIKYFQSEIPNSIRFASATAYQGLPATLAKADNVFIEAYYDFLDELIDLGIIKED